MRTKLSLFCDNLIEAVWLAAAVVTPVLFNVRSAKVFEVDKIALVRSLALLMALAWAVRTSERRGASSDEGAEVSLGQRLKAFLRRPLVLPALALAVTHAVATAASLWPHGSLWGSYERRQGLLATLSYVAIFLLTLQNLRRRSQIDRLVGLVIVTSLPVSLYALAQRFGLDPVPWSKDVAQRVASTLGNPIFTAGYLIMVVPLGLSRAVNAVRQAVARADERGAGIASAGFYGAVVLLHLVTIVLTQSRGPLMGLLGGLFFFLLAWSVAEGRRAWMMIAVALAVLGGGLLLILNLPQTPLAAVKSWPYVGRLTSLRGDPSLRSRAIMWESGLVMATEEPLRAVIGHGPESARVAFYPYITPELADILGTTLTTGRFHNETMDALVGTGLMGLLAYLVLFGSVFLWILRTLGLIENDGGTRRFAAALAAGALLGLPGSWLLTGGPRLVALTVPAGLLLAMAAYLVVVGLRDRAEVPVTTSRSMLLIALLAALVAHFVEIQTGIAVTATRTQFWLYAALVGALALGVEEGPEADPETSRRDRGRRRRGARGRERDRAPLLERPRAAAALVYGLGVGLLLITLGFAFFTRAFDLRPADWAVVGMLILAWLLGGAATTLETARLPASDDGDEPAGWGSVVAIYGVVSLGVLAIYLPFHVAATNVAGPATGVVTLLYVFLLVAILALALALGRLRRDVSPSPQTRRRDVSPSVVWRQDRWWLYPILTLLVALLVWRVNLTIVRADILFAEAQTYQGAGRLDRSIELYRRAIDLAPRQDHYYPLLGQAYLRKASSAEQAVWFERTEEVFERARELSPRRPDHYANLGLLYYHWGRRMENPARAGEKLERALSYYERATDMSPYTQGQLLEEHRVRAHLRLTDVYLAQGAFERAIEEARAAAQLAPDEQGQQIEDQIARLRADRVGYWADLEPDCRVDAGDVQVVADRWRCQEGAACYSEALDGDGDGTITVVDVMRLVTEWGWTCP